MTIHLSASSTLDVATSSLVIKVGHGSPMSHTKIPGEVNFIAVKWSQNVVDLEILFHKRNWYLTKLAEHFWKKWLA